MSVENIQVHVENIKCGGCEKSIVKGLTEIEGLSNILIDRDQQLVTVTAEAALRSAVGEKRKKMGYPEQGSVGGIEAGLAHAKSFVSCAIGRLS